MREKILIDALEEIKKILGTGFIGESMGIATKALSDYASQKDGLKWVKARERMPDKSANTTKNSFAVKAYNRKDAIYWDGDDWLWIGTSNKVSKGEFEMIWWLDESSAPESGGDELTINDYREVLEDHKQLVRQLDVIINGENAANQPSLCDIVSQLRVKHTPPTKESGGDDVPNKSNSDVTPVASHSSTSSNSIEQEIFKALSDLVNLKNYKEAYGKTAEYEEQQPKVWEAARQAIYKHVNTYNENKG